MFTGIIEETGTVLTARQQPAGYEMTFRAERVLEGTRAGDSIAVDGVCLTVTRFDARSFTVNLAPETLGRTTLGRYGAGTAVNLERSLTPTTRMGGHFVQGHVDAVGTVVEVRPDRDSLWLTIRVEPDIMRWIVPKGFIALDGISLTVVDVFDDRFSVMLVSYTQSHVTLPSRTIGDGVNIEADILGKYVERMLSARSVPTASTVDRAFLKKHGYE